MAEILSNYAFSTLNEPSGIDDSQTTFDVLDASGFPGSGNFRIAVDQELMLVTAVSSNTLTVTRAIEGTLATVHVNSSTVASVLTAGGIVQYVSEH